MALEPDPLSDADLLDDQLDEDPSFVDEDHAEPIPPADIVSYNELRSCADLYRLYRNGKLEIQPDFQREVVWKRDEQSRFIDSLVKQLPIPSMCFSLDYTTQRWKVIDGLQRMSSIINFLDGDFKLSPLDDILPLLRGESGSSLSLGPPECQRLVDLVQDVSIPVTVLRCDYSQDSHMRYLFTIFHRLNSGGVRLTNQEIRNCIYTSPFNDLLKRFDHSDDAWRRVKPRIWGSMRRYRSVELLLRTLAFGENLNHYDGNLARFLNDYMHSQSNRSPDDLRGLEAALVSTVRIVESALAGSSGKVPLTMIEALLVGAFHLRNQVRPENEYREAFANLLRSSAFVDAAKYGVSSVDNVTRRIAAATDALRA